MVTIIATGGRTAAHDVEASDVEVQCILAEPFFAIGVFNRAIGVNEWRHDSGGTENIVENVGEKFCGWTHGFNDELELYGSDAVSRSIAIIFHDSCRIDRHVGFDHMRYYLTVTNVGATDRVEINIIRGIGDLTSLICIIIFFHVTYCPVL